MDKIKLRGKLTIIKNGETVTTVENLITNVGFAEMSGLLLTDIGGTAFDYIAIGIGTTAAAVTDTTLETESMRVSGTGTQTTTSVTNDTAHLECTFNITSTLAITEAGMLNAASSGDLLNHQIFSAVNVVNTDTLIIKWDVGFS